MEKAGNTRTLKTFSLKGYLVIAFMITLGSTADSAPACFPPASVSSSAGGKPFTSPAGPREKQMGKANDATKIHFPRLNLI
ncbi:MAG: hypothetical protein IJ156_04210 [Bacteroidales bacterium]|nr:hypothetical protein [Bacteroidales bacterium]